MYVSHKVLNKVKQYLVIWKVRRTQKDLSFILLKFIKIGWSSRHALSQLNNISTANDSI